MGIPFFFSRRRDFRRAGPPPELVDSIYEQFRSGKFPDGEQEQALTLESIEATPQKITLNFLPPAPDELVKRALSRLGDRYYRNFDVAVINTFDEYCQRHLLQPPWREGADREFFERISQQKGLIFSQEHSVYANVQLVKNGNTKTVVDLAQDGLVACIHVVGGNKEKERHTKHNAILRKAAAFFEQHYGPVKAYRIDGTKSGPDWQVSVVNIPL